MSDSRIVPPLEDSEAEQLAEAEKKASFTAKATEKAAEHSIGMLILILAILFSAFLTWAKGCVESGAIMAAGAMVKAAPRGVAPVTTLVVPKVAPETLTVVLKDVATSAGARDVVITAEPLQPPHAQDTSTTDAVVDDHGVCVLQLPSSASRQSGVILTARTIGGTPLLFRSGGRWTDRTACSAREGGIVRRSVIRADSPKLARAP